MKTLVSIVLFCIMIDASEIAIANNISGQVMAQKGSQSVSLKNGSSLEGEMIISTKENSSVTIIFKDHSEVVLGSNALLNLEKFVFKPIEKEYDFQLFLEKGSLAFESGKIGELAPEAFVFKTPDGTVAIRGTKFFIKLQ